VTVTLEQAKDNLAQWLAQAEAGEEILIGNDPTRPVAKLVALAPTRCRLARHPDLVGSTETHDRTALVRPLPPEEWGELAGR
jgi:antitoxin (DNA-binding transcriptional repressor) of toxin-antitoxin stability system